MNTIYSTYRTTETGPPVEVVPTKSPSYLPQSYYISMVISELCSLDDQDTFADFHVSISEIMDRIQYLIAYIHDDEEVKATTATYFSDFDNVMKVLTYMSNSGLLKISDHSVIVNCIQLDYLRDYLLEFYDL